MKAAYITKCGPANEIIYGDLPTPTLKDSEILIRTASVAVNPVDTYIRSGLVAMPLTFPFVIGCDVAGVVEAVGPTASRFKIGDRVWGSNQGLLGRQGTFAELIAVDECWMYPLPKEIEFDQAAALALVGITAHLGLIRDAKLQPGETLFVNGGTGGVGSVVVQMAKILGARVITTVGSEEKVKYAKELGADVVVNYKKADVDAEIRAAAPDGVNVFWETLREPNFQRAVPLLAERGRMVIMAGREAMPVFPVGPFYVKGCSLFGFVMFKATPAEQRACAEDMNRWMSAGKLKATIGKKFKLSQAAESHQLQEDNTLQKSGTLMGKIVLNS